MYTEIKILARDKDYNCAVHSKIQTYDPYNNLLKSQKYISRCQETGLNPILFDLWQQKRCSCGNRLCNMWRHVTYIQTKLLLYFAKKYKKCQIDNIIEKTWGVVRASASQLGDLVSFHQHFTREFFARTSFRQLFCSYIEKAAETTFVRKIHTWNVDEIEP